MIQLFKVSKRYGVNFALNDITMRIRKGDFAFITGPSGAGKTTLLRLIFGTASPTAGQILIDGINLSRISRLKMDLLRRKVGFVFQDYKLLNNRTVFQNVALALEVTGEDGAGNIRKRTIQALKSVGLSGKEKAFPLELSGGEQQRVAIARAIINEPMLLIADEPTGNLDPDITKEIMVLFRSVNLKGTTLVIATHNRELLKDTGQRIITLDKGRLAEEMNP